MTTDQFFKGVMILHFGINCFMAGKYYEEERGDDRKIIGVIFFVTFWILFYCLISAFSNIVYFITWLYNKTWFYYYFKLKSYEKNLSLMSDNPKKLLMAQSAMRIRKWFPKWLKIKFDNIVEKKLTELRNDRIKHNEEVNF